MDIAFTDEQRMFRKAVADFVTREIVPFVERWEEEEGFPRDLFCKMGELGFLGVNYPEEYGGGGEDLVTASIFFRGAGLRKPGRRRQRSGPRHPGNGAPDVVRYPRAENQVSGPRPAGEKMAAFALTEPNAGSDAASVATTAVADGEGYLINGTKMFITNGTIADYVIVVAVTDRARRTRGMSLFIVERGMKGFEVGRKLRKRGYASRIRPSWFSTIVGCPGKICWVPWARASSGP